MRPRPPRRQQGLLLVRPQPRVVRPEKAREELRGKRGVIDLFAAGERREGGGQDTMKIISQPVYDTKETVVQKGGNTTRSSFPPVPNGGVCAHHALGLSNDDGLETNGLFSIRHASTNNGSTCQHQQRFDMTAHHKERKMSAVRPVNNHTHHYTPSPPPCRKPGGRPPPASAGAPPPLTPGGHRSTRAAATRPRRAGT